VETTRSSIKNLPTSGIGLLLAISEDSEAISLGVGSPNFDTPPHIIGAANHALHTGRSHYSPDYGIPELQTAIASKIASETGVYLDPLTEIVVTAGSSPALFNSIMSLVDTNDDVLIPTPSYFAYDFISRIVGGHSIIVPSYEEHGFVPTPDDLAEAVTPESKVLVICSPNNPTGAVWGLDSLKAAADIAMDHNLIVLSDELYQRIVFDGTVAHSILEIDGLVDRCIVINGLSKSHAMAGFRIGWVAGSEELLEGFKALHQYNSICAPMVSQHAALAALTGPDEPVREMIDEYARRRNLLVGRLAGEVPLMSVKAPKGSIFMFPSVKHLIESHLDDMVAYLKGTEGRMALNRLPPSLFRMEDLQSSGSLVAMLFLYARARVVTASGSFFGKSGEGFIRMSFAPTSEAINEAVDRIIRALEPWE
jgi:aspartate/methionine/tyrosine aminotransferase